MGKLCAVFGSPEKVSGRAAILPPFALPLYDIGLSHSLVF